ncbi:MAG: XRE family transcriptional regulator [Deinococcales bacterium]
MTEAKPKIRPLSDLYEEFSPEEQREIELGKQLLIMEYELLSELRKSRKLTQKEIAQLLEIGQSAVSKLEGQDDILVRTLVRYVQALGGELELRVKFPDTVVTLGQFGQHLCSPPS